jgi:hypothetical protein
VSEQDCKEIYQALENLYGDLYLVGCDEIKLKDVYEGSFRAALEVLVKHQKYRDDAGEGPTGCSDDGDELSKAMRGMTHQDLNRILDNVLK